MTQQMSFGEAERREGEHLRDAGTAAVLAAVDVDWTAAASGVMEEFIAAGREFTADEVTYYAGLPDRRNAVGALFRRYVAAGRIIRVGWTTTTRPSRRAAALAVWKAV